MIKTKKWPLWLLALPLAAAANTESSATAVIIDNGIKQLQIADFTPITSSWAGRNVITGYEALLDVDNSSGADSLLFNATAELSATWFAANFIADINITCSGIPVGYDLAQGYRAHRYSIPGQVQISELRKGVSDCKQIKINISKRGSLSRQFFTQIESIDFDLSIESIKGAK
ncbi:MULTISPECIES: hypothetical protein [Pseudoalteromonas]|uniref:hypothetical protein n=1 Tax=Pseudoalteromonas TaxID=53246 RepID=UPI000E35A23C|nr:MULTISPECIES: hypothetical protein [Pseudoalteromonas]AXQ98393.1 hypothetical protein D0N37_12075 [Pseudoalteromonas piscicida]MCO7201287.1 hypothetical protein [Pseudoalteromonas sp. OANN1]